MVTLKEYFNTELPVQTNYVPKILHKFWLLRILSVIAHLSLLLFSTKFFVPLRQIVDNYFLSPGLRKALALSNQTNTPAELIYSIHGSYTILATILLGLFILLSFFELLKSQLDKHSFRFRKTAYAATPQEAYKAVRNISTKFMLAMLAITGLFIWYIFFDFESKIDSSIVRIFISEAYLVGMFIFLTSFTLQLKTLLKLKQLSSF